PPDAQPAATPQPAAPLYSLSLTAVRRPGLHDVPVGHVPAGDGHSRAAPRLHRHTGNLAAALAAVPLHVHVRSGKAALGRPELVEPLGALLSLPHAAPAYTARVVRRASA